MKKTKRTAEKNNIKGEVKKRQSGRKNRRGRSLERQHREKREEKENRDPCRGLTNCLQGGILVELFSWWLLFVGVGDLAQIGVGMWMAHLLEQRRSGYCIVHLGGI